MSANFHDIEIDRKVTPSTDKTPISRDATMIKSTNLDLGLFYKIFTDI